ncbi:MAG: 50S ribosomal protein L1 [Planctomycetaceae bacterium]|nr:50S ribosomal protein L1 [Planctomycetaceae bacterium]
MAKRSKRMRAMAEKAPGKESLSLQEAVKVLKGFNTTKFDQSVEIAMRLGINPKQADQMVRGSIVLPHGIGKTVRVAVFAKGDKIDEAKAAGAELVGGPELAAEVKAGNINFDVCIATPDMMGVVGPLGRILGPRGLMPAPRNGTVTMDVAKVIQEYKAGKVEFRNDAGGNVQAIVGKLSFTEEQLAENIQKFMDYIQSLKPATAKGQYVKGTVISATMSPGVRVQQL